MKQKLRVLLAGASVVAAVGGGLTAALPAAAHNMPVPYSCQTGTFGEMHDEYLWWYKFKSQRFSQGTYYNKYEVGITSYPAGVTYLGTIERACGHSNF